MRPGAAFHPGRVAWERWIGFRAALLRSVFVLLLALASGCTAAAPTYRPAPAGSPVVAPGSATLSPSTLNIPDSDLTIRPQPNPTRYDPLVTSLLQQGTRSAATPAPAGAMPQNPSQPQPSAPAAATATPLPTGLLAGGTLGLIPSTQGLWAMRPDGTQATLLTNDPIWRMAVSPGGTMVAYITHPDPHNPPYEKPYGYQLKILTLKDDQAYTITPLSAPGVSANSSQEELNSVFQTLHAYDNGGLAWAPDGRTLAFVSSHEGPNGDVYLYTPGSGWLRPLTHFHFAEGPAHAFQLDWSDDGLRLFYSAAFSFGSGGGTWLAGAWVSSIDGAQTQVAPGSQTAGEKLVAWLPRPDVGLMLSSYNPDCGDQNLRAVHLRNNQVTTLWPHCYADQIASHGKTDLLISVTPALNDPQNNNPPGLYRVSVDRPEPVKISDRGFEKLYSGDASAYWYGYNTGEGFFAISYTGQITPAFTGAPYDGPSGATARLVTRLNDGAWLFSNGPDGLLLARPNSPPEGVLHMPVENLTASSTYPGLYFFFSPRADGSMGLFAFSTRDWKPYEVDPRIQDPQGIHWNH